MSQLQPGTTAPDFRGIDENGNEHALSDYRGSKLILFFYPRDMTPGCTKEACNLRDNYSTLKNKGFELLGVSPDHTRSHQKFIEKENLPFHLLADTDKEIIKAYGAWGPKKFRGREYEGVLRTTYIIDEHGKVQHAFTKVKTRAHAEQILELVH